MDRILSYIEQQDTFRHVPMISLLIQGRRKQHSRNDNFHEIHSFDSGDGTSVVDIIGNINRHIPTIIVKVSRVQIRS
jgi:hypothetical protein